MQLAAAPALRALQQPREALKVPGLVVDGGVQATSITLSGGISTPRLGAFAPIPSSPNSQF